MQGTTIQNLSFIFKLFLHEIFHMYSMEIIHCNKTEQ